MPVFAYLDPATGTLIVSAVVGAFAAAALVIKNSWYKIKRVFVPKKDEPVSDTSNEPRTAAEVSADTTPED
ncbi:MAG: hypothetical protein ACR2N2_10425 [Acidimicrobiia bacterium]